MLSKPNSLSCFSETFLKLLFNTSSIDLRLSKILVFSATTILEALAAASKGAANCLSIGISLTILLNPSNVFTEKFEDMAFDWDSTWSKFAIRFWVKITWSLRDSDIA